MGTWNTNEICEGCTDCCGDVDYDDACEECQEHRDDNCGQPHSKPTQPTTWRVEHMNTTIAKLFEKTADAVLVNKFYGSQIQQTDVEVIKLKGKEKDLLAAAQAKQANEDARNNVVRAQIVS